MRERRPFKRVSVTEAQRLLDQEGVLVFDIRDRHVHDRAHIPGARHLSIISLTQYFAGTPKDGPILIYCYHGYASQEYAQIFSDFGFLAVHSLDGGYDGWVQAELPVTKIERSARKVTLSHDLQI